MDRIYTHTPFTQRLLGHIVESLASHACPFGHLEGRDGAPDGGIIGGPPFIGGGGIKGLEPPAGGEPVRGIIGDPGEGLALPAPGVGIGIGGAAIGIEGAAIVWNPSILLRNFNIEVRVK